MVDDEHLKLACRLAIFLSQFLEDSALLGNGREFADQDALGGIDPKLFYSGFDVFHGKLLGLVFYLGATLYRHQMSAKPMIGSKTSV